jgi:hypothetical protein
MIFFGPAAPKVHWGGKVPAAVLRKQTNCLSDVVMNFGRRRRLLPTLAAGYNFEERACCRCATDAAFGNKWLNHLLQSPAANPALAEVLPSTT